MRIQSFLERHGVERNPFAEEDAQTDQVFKEHCIDSTYHPTWDKIFGDAADPSTSIVFGEKGAGKTAMRLQIAKALRAHNRQHPNERVFIVHYDDFNPFLDRFTEHLSARRRRRAERALGEWKLWDHMDAILSLAVTGIVDRILENRQPSDHVECELGPQDVEKLDHYQARDLLLLAACYDQSSSETYRGRWQRLAKRLKFWTLKAHWDLLVGGVVTLVGLCLLVTLAMNGVDTSLLWLCVAVVALGWAPFLWRFANRHLLAHRVARQLRVGRREAGPLRQILMNFSGGELSGQPLPSHARTDDRYELLHKLQGILRSWGHVAIVVLVDRVDEPHLINGSSKLMRQLIWPVLDNKFLKQPGIGFKLMLPVELKQFIDRESNEFYERARLDKQNTIPSLRWTGEALYDVANARLQACALNGSKPDLKQFFDESISEQRLMEVLRSLRVPRHLFKFMYRLLVTHCNSHTDVEPVWKIPSKTFESELALYNRDLEAFDRGVGSG